MAVVYQHIRKDTNEVFYVGIGSNLKRPYSKNNRNTHWKNIVNKVGYYVEIIYPDLDWKLACNMEQYLIEAYGRKDLGLGELVNLTDGGEGTLGSKQSDETKRKKSQSMLGKKHSDETKRKIGKSGKGKKRTESTLIKMSECRKGEKSVWFGRKHSEETKRKMSESNKKSQLGKKRSIESINKQKQNHCSKKEGYVNPMQGKVSPNAKRVINTKTNEVFSSLKKAYNSKVLGIGYTTFCNMINGNRINKTNFKYVENI